jgi:hypothetical protein
MHLTPGFLRVLRQSAGALLMGSALVVTACAPRTDPPPALPVPVPVEPAPPPVERRPLVALAPDSATYDALSIVVTTERSPGTAVTDSVSYTESIRAVLSGDVAPRYRVTLISDSGYNLPPDRLPPPETVRKEVQPVISTRYFGASPTENLAQADTTVACPSQPSLVSPLLTNAIAQYLLNASRHEIVRRAALDYKVCSAGVFRTISGYIEYDIDRNTPAQVQTSFVIQASISADSSRALPMRVSGTMMGTMTTMPGSDVHVLPDSLELQLITEIIAQSSTRMQEFQQRVTTRLIKRN